jgi:hypothetical protein
VSDAAWAAFGPDEASAGQQPEPAPLSSWEAWPPATPSVTGAAPAPAGPYAPETPAPAEGADVGAQRLTDGRVPAGAVTTPTPPKLAAGKIDDIRGLIASGMAVGRPGPVRNALRALGFSFAAIGYPGEDPGAWTEDEASHYVWGEVGRDRIDQWWVASRSWCKNDERRLLIRA